MSLDHFHEKSLLITLLQQLDAVEKGIVKRLIKYTKEESSKSASTKTTKNGSSPEKSAQTPSQKCDFHHYSTERKGAKYKEKELGEVREILHVKETKKLMCNFIMPMLLLITRFSIELIFRLNYKQFFSNIGPTGNKNYAGMGVQQGPGQEA